MSAPVLACISRILYLDDFLPTNQPTNQTSESDYVAALKIVIGTLDDLEDADCLLDVEEFLADIVSEAHRLLYDK